MLQNENQRYTDRIIYCRRHVSCRQRYWHQIYYRGSNSRSAIFNLLAIAGVILAKYLPGRIPAVAYIVTLGCILTYPTMPGSDVINEAVKKVGFLQLCTPILAYAGIAIGKDLDAFAKSGWRIVVVACVVFTGTYIGSAIIAQTILKALGQI